MIKCKASSVGAFDAHAFLTSFLSSEPTHWSSFETLRNEQPGNSGLTSKLTEPLWSVSKALNRKCAYVEASMERTNNQSQNICRDYGSLAAVATANKKKVQSGDCFFFSTSKKTGSRWEGRTVCLELRVLSLFPLCCAIMFTGLPFFSLNRYIKAS